MCTKCNHEFELLPELETILNENHGGSANRVASNSRTIQSRRIQELPSQFSKYIGGSLLPNKRVAAKKLILQSESQSEVFTAIIAGVNIFRLLVDLGGSISWNKAWMEGSVKFSFDKQGRFNKGPWKEAEPIIVKQSMKRYGGVETLFFSVDDLISASFKVEYQYNGYSVGNIRVTNIDSEPSGLWNLFVDQHISPDLNAYEIRGKKPIAMVELTFAYTFKIISQNDEIWIAKYQLYGNGEVGLINGWQKGGNLGDFKYPHKDKIVTTKPISR
jgi:hypothetical protein